MLVAILLWSLLAAGLPSAASQEVECPSGTTEVLGSCFFLSRGDTLNWDEAESVSSVTVGFDDTLIFSQKQFTRKYLFFIVLC